mmetsp:Transcript_11609/g.71403  ORF Transcript_11609/g.71403 Transcript_11609/m.71403 type:complete len:88 (-) Transcript_11609:485-748(-)
MWEWCDFRWLAGVHVHLAQAGQVVLPINIHGTGATDSLSVVHPNPLLVDAVGARMRNCMLRQRLVLGLLCPSKAFVRVSVPLPFSPA